MNPTRVLIVDDVPDVRQELSLLLSLTGDITVIGEAADGTDAVCLAEAIHPEVILMDLEMPLMDGFEAARRIKTRLPDCRIIALTIHDTPASREKCAEAGMDGFLSKGGPLQTLIQAVRGERQEQERK